MQLTVTMEKWKVLWFWLMMNTGTLTIGADGSYTYTIRTKLQQMLWMQGTGGNAVYDTLTDVFVYRKC